jgi:cell division protein FtsB
MIEIFHLINQIHDFIANHQLTPAKLLMITLIFMIITVLSIREMMCWFLKVHSVRKELRNLKKEVHGLEHEIRLLRKSLGHETQAPEEKTDSPLIKAKSNPFKIFH